MSVNGVTGVNSQDAYNTYNSLAKKTSTSADTTSTATAADTDDTAAVYEKTDTTKTDTTKTDTTKTYTQNTDLIAKMQADAEARTAQLRSLVEQMISKQGNAYGKANDIWSFLASGDFTVDEATKKQAQADVAEDGYWGVDQTSDRILDFAEALSGGDPEKMEKMREAFKQGFEEATKTWGKDLPSISSDTYDAVMKKFDDFAQKANGSSTTTPAATVVAEESLI